ncbi:MAG TPA: metallophosphoesterase [Saprospiraceae bacterium]|nr:metallophosphoesterase [Saprospiraceae bacterium]
MLFVAAALIILVILFVLINRNPESLPNHEPPITIKKEFMEGPFIFYKEKGLELVKAHVIGNHVELIKNRIDEKAAYKELYNVHSTLEGVHFSFKVLPKHSVPSDFYPYTSPILAISDIEGDFEYLNNILKSQGVIDSEYSWTFGTGRLVVLGDIFDRGNRVTETFWLLYKLEQEAALAGGAVHVILGNHEAMALSGDDRYLHRKYRIIFDKNRGKFKDYFNNQTVLGRWLRTKNAIEIIGNILFVHGGLSIELLEWGVPIDQINELVRNNVDADIFRKKGATAEEKMVMGSYGPLWYRGLVDEDLDQEDVDRILDHFAVEHIVVGHTVVPEVTMLYDKRIIAIDVDRRNKSGHQALLVENGMFFRVDTESKKLPLHPIQ